MNPLPQIKFNAPLRIMVIEDNQIDTKILESMLYESSAPPELLKIAKSLAAAEELVKENDFDIAILDLNIQDSHGEETLLKLKKICPDIPIVVNTGAYEEELGLKTLSLGAQDFLVKGRYSAYMLNKVLHYSLERKRVELALIKANRRLIETQNQLSQSEKMKVVGSLASGVAHEVKNPLATIIYGITYLKEQVQSQNDNVKMIIDNIKEAGERANGIINDLLDFASLTKLIREPCDLGELVKKSLALTKHEYEKKHIIVNFEIQDGIPALNLDKNKIIQVFVNLILNAVHATPKKGALDIKINMVNFSDQFKEVNMVPDNIFETDQSVSVVTIEDTGCGIPPKDIHKIFDPFYTTRRGKGGVGLGLSVTKNIVDIHEGFVNIANRPDNQGARAILIFGA